MKSDAVRKIGFTGSTRVGKMLMSQAAATVKKVRPRLSVRTCLLVSAAVAYSGRRSTACEEPSADPDPFTLPICGSRTAVGVGLRCPLSVPSMPCSCTKFSHCGCSTLL